ncbi:hypothetical protein E2C01_046162 [Portunus trituberculatus]|uniref:Uncharacterized protein n=1 Tax=Portunus trituberculatus TaxID=210409 RepID=A0A5B7G556_PORTR|nr:hypothetical protein [Portunus trituberculatus]
MSQTFRGGVAARPDGVPAALLHKHRYKSRRDTHWHTFLTWVTARIENPCFVLPADAEGGRLAPAQLTPASSLPRRLHTGKEGGGRWTLVATLTRLEGRREGGKSGVLSTTGI